MYTGGQGYLGRATANNIGALTEVVSPATIKSGHFFKPRMRRTVTERARGPGLGAKVGSKDTRVGPIRPRPAFC